MERAALDVGFGRRPDYPHLGASPLSAGDWKGDSIVACVFAHEGHAQEFVDKCIPGLRGLGSDVRGVVVSVKSEVDRMYIAIITSNDLVAADEQDTGQRP